MNKIINILKSIKNERKTFWYFLVFIIILLVIISIFIFRDEPSSKKGYPKDNLNSVTENRTSINQKETGKIRHPLNGEFMEKEEELSIPVAAVIDNHKKARPAYGLEMADIVFEAEVEGGITRYLAIFKDAQKIKKLGPIRSARPYFVDWANGISALFVHCGGSPQALAKIAASGVKDINEFYNSPYFERDNNIKRPHNIFTSGEKLKRFLKNSSYKKTIQSIEPWNFKKKNNTIEEENKQEEISIEYKPPYNVKWKYKKGEGYIRYLNNSLYRTGDNNIIKASNVIIQINPAKVRDEKLRLKMDTLGAGKVFVCSNGSCQKGEWRKKSSSDRIQYYTKDGKIMPLIPGLTWTQVVKSVKEINIANYEF
jgi:hypothetical protein